MLSKNGVGLVVLLFSFIGLQLDANVVADVLSAVGTLISFGLMVWNQLSRDDVDKFLMKK